MSARPSTSTDSAVDPVRERLRVLAERGRRQVVAGAVLQVARLVDRASDHGGLRDGVRRSVEEETISTLEAPRAAVRLLGRRGLVPLETVVGEHRSLHQRCRNLRIAVCGQLPAERLADSSRARSQATAAATRARSAVSSLRLPRPTMSQRLPAAWVSASALNERRASPEASSSATSGGVACEPGSLPSNTPTATVSASVARGLGGGGACIVAQDTGCAEVDRASYA